MSRQESTDIRISGTDRLSEPAPLWRRILASAIELPIIGILVFIGYLVDTPIFGYDMPLSFSDSQVPDRLSLAICISLWILLNIVSDTLAASKRSMGIMIVDAENLSDVSLRRSFGRAVLKVLVLHLLIVGAYSLTVYAISYLVTNDLVPQDAFLGVLFVPLLLAAVMCTLAATIGILDRQRRGLHDRVFSTIAVRA